MALDVVFHDQRFNVSVFHIEAEFVLAKRRVQGSGDTGRNGHKGVP